MWGRLKSVGSRTLYEKCLILIDDRGRQNKYIKNTDKMEKEKYKLVINDKVYNTDDTFDELVQRIKTSMEKSAESAKEKGLIPPLNDDTIERVMSHFIIVEVGSEKEFDGSGFPIEGKFVLKKGDMTKKLNVINLDEAVQYLYTTAERENDWLLMIRDNVDFNEVVNGYSITNTKTDKTYDPHGIEQ